MKRYSEWAPTGFDTKGLALPEQQDWLVLNVAHNRDSDILEQSNFDSAIVRLEDKGCGEYEIHRFGHWACGWFEIILVKPGTATEAQGRLIEADLAEYPILDENDFSDREWYAEQERIAEEAAS